MNETVRLMHAHRSIRRFQPAPVPREHVEEAVRAGQMAATSSAVQAYSVIHVTDPGRLDELADLAGPQEKIRRCGAFLAVLGDTRRHRLLCERRGLAYANTFENFLVAVIDASLFAQNLVLAFESMGYGTCYIGGLRNDLNRVARVLETPEGVYPVFGLCVGLPGEAPEARPRLPVDTTLFTDAYPGDEDLLTGVERYDGAYRDYLERRGTTPQGWSDHMVSRHAHPTRPDVRGFYASRGASLD